VSAPFFVIHEKDKPKMEKSSKLKAVSKKEINKIAILTSGGDAPGMNPCIRACVRCGISAGFSMYGVYGGFKGLVAGDIVDLNTRSVGGILHFGGTILGTSRFPEFKKAAIQKQAIENLKAYSIDGLVVIGGEGSLHGALDLEKQGYPVVGVPATIDNDVNETDYAIGFDTAVNTVLEAIYRLRDTAASHGRLVILETMGRHAGHIALAAGLAGGAEVIITPERKLSMDEIEKQVAECFARKKLFTMVVVAEGAGNAYDISNELRKRLDKEVATTVLGYIQRGGTPTAFDTLLASQMGAMAVESFREGKSGYMTSYKNGKHQLIPIVDVLKKQKPLSEELYALYKVLAK